MSNKEIFYRKVLQKSSIKMFFQLKTVGKKAEAQSRQKLTNPLNVKYTKTKAPG